MKEIVCYFRTIIIYAFSQNLIRQSLRFFARFFWNQPLLTETKNFKNLCLRRPTTNFSFFHKAAVQVLNFFFKTATIQLMLTIELQTKQNTIYKYTNFLERGFFMASIHITSDSTCDLSAEQIARHNIGIMPLYVRLGDETMRDGVNITAQDIFRYVDETGQLPKTAAPSVADYIDFFKEQQKEPDTAVIHFSISAKFSSSYQNACIAADELENVTVIDSMNLSTGHGLAVLEACRLAEQGASVEEIIKHEEEVIPKIRASFILDRLDYLHKGGRCSGVAALGANLLKLKPCIEVVDGEMRVGKKYRGTLDKVLPLYTADRLAGKQIRKDLIFITHTGCDKKIVDSVRAKVNELYSFDEVVETIAGCTVTSHCGQNTLGVLFIEE